MHPTPVPHAQQGYARPGEILLGKYRVEEVIGIGGMGCVVRASHLYLQQPVAIKILLPTMVEHQSTVQRFMREAQATVKLRSEHIARVMDVSTLPDGTPVMVMEYLEGHDLNQILRHHGPQMPQAVVDLMLQACEGISEAHALGIIHRDIKPSNFFITRRPDGSNLLKILDFGISKAGGDGLSELTGTQTVVGTPTYMAPEQMQTARSTDPRSDIWSMGVVMYQLLAGRPPFEAENYAQLVLMVANNPPAPLTTPLPGGLANIVLRCLEKDPKNRIQNVGELARMLAPYASDPLSAQQSAERASRILAAPRGSQPGFPLTSSAGAGVSLTPPALTPKSWGNNTSSVGGAAGQMGTKVVRGGRGLVIAGVATLCIAAGAGGFMLAKRGGGGDKDTHVTAPEPAATTATMPATMPAQPPVAPPTPPTTTATAPATPTVPTTAAKTETAKTSTSTKPTTAKTETTKSTTAKTETAKATTAKATTAKTETAKATAKTTSRSTTTKTHKTTSKTDDLFDDRH
ncbi:MAG: serine/threonine protein kinase [Acidobacteriota bacterium]